jgi:hypothetical protein
MESSGPIKGPSATAELAKIAGVLDDEAQRKSLKADFDGTLERARVDMSMVPTTLQEVLKRMSVEELAAVARFNKALVDAGFEVEPPDGYPDGGRVGFF